MCSPCRIRLVLPLDLLCCVFAVVTAGKRSLMRSERIVIFATGARAVAVDRDDEAEVPPTLRDTHAEMNQLAVEPSIKAAVPSAYLGVCVEGGAIFQLLLPQVS